MKIVLDSTVFRADFHMTGTHFTLLFDGLESIPASLQVPAVVVDEVVNAYREWLETEKRAYHKQIDVLKRLIPGRTRRKPRIDVERHVENYRSHLENTIKSHGAILPYPNVKHQQVVARALTRKKPFGANDAGYRDYLIWQNVKSQVPWGSEKLVFVSANSSDFGSNELHPDLATEILNPSRVRLIRDLAEFNREYVTPRLKAAESLKVELQNGTAPFDIADWVHKNFLDALHDGDLVLAVTPFPPGVGSAYPVDVLRFGRIAIRDVGELTSGDKFVRVEVVAEVEVSVDVDGRDYAKSPEVRDWVGGYMDDSTSSSSNHSIALRVVIELTLDASSSEVATFYVESIEMN
jgi:predicted nucleic acid-binding protein